MPGHDDPRAILLARRALDGVPEDAGFTEDDFRVRLVRELTEFAFGPAVKANRAIDALRRKVERLMAAPPEASVRMVDEGNGPELVVNITVTNVHPDENGEALGRTIAEAVRQEIAKGAT